jgi:hypothetical protein
MALNTTGICDYRTGKVVRMYWTPSTKSIEACCAAKATTGLSMWMCMALCYFCCQELIIEYECPEGGTGGFQPKPTDDVRDFPTTTPSDQGLSFTTSAYGVPLPIVFGSDKLTGNVFWATPVRKNLLPGGSEYYSSLSFAFGICEGEINGVLRMWLGDKLIFDMSSSVDGSGVMQPNADGFLIGRTVDLTDEASPLRNLSATARQTKISVFTGSETQLPEGVMLDTEGADNVPGYRGVAYVLFENFITAGTNVPNIFVEVTSNTENTYPRLYGNPADPEEHFDRPDGGGTAVIIDQSYDLIYAGFYDSNGTATPASGAGVGVWKYDDLDLVDEIEIEVTFDLSAIDWKMMRLLPQSGNLIVHKADGNAGITSVINPFASYVMDTLGPGGNSSDHSLANGIAASSAGSIAFVALGASGAPTDVFMGIGSSNKSIGFLEIDANGQIDFVSNLTQPLPDTRNRSAAIKYNASGLEANPTFIDGTSTAGHHVMIVSGASNEKVEFHICRVTIYSSTVRLATPVYAEIDTISCDDLAGAGASHNVEFILIDPSDMCMVIFFSVTNSSRNSWACKYNQHTGEIVWSKPAPDLEDDGPGADMATLASSTYAWIGKQSTASIYKMDLKTGAVETLVDNITDQSLPPVALGGQFYNGIEDSITYVSTTADKKVVKTYLERVTRSTVEVSTIVQNLLTRVGLLATDMDISDLTALTLHGYTISERKSLRDVFEELSQVFKFDVVESNGRILYKSRGGAVTTTIDHKYLSDEGEGWLDATDDNDISRIRKLELKYRDLDRDYRDNVQSIILPKYNGESFDNAAGISVDVPVVLTSTLAKTLAEILLYAKLTYDTTFRAKLPPRFIELDPGDVVDITDAAGGENITARVKSLQIGADRAVEAELVEENPDIYTDTVNLFGSVGRYNESLFQPLSARVDPVILSIPYRDESEVQEALSQYTTYVTFLNNRTTSAVTRDVLVSVDGDTTNLITVTKPANFPTWGIVLNPPDFKTAVYSTDTTSELRIKLVSATGATLASSTHADLLADDQCNLCYVDGELLQFETVVDEGDNVYLLTNLHRAKFGTDVLIGNQTVGGKFILIAGNDAIIDEGSVRTISVPAEGMPKKVLQFIITSGNPMQNNPTMIVDFINLRAWSVNGFRGDYDTGSGDCTFSWQRRTRYDGEYPDDGDETAPLNEVDESYVLYLFDDPATLNLYDSSTYLRKVELTTNSYTYTDAMQTADGFDRSTTGLYAAVSQQGSVTDARSGVVRNTYVYPI